MSNSLEQIDTTIEVIAPENIAFTYRGAGPFRRFPAFLIDLFVRLGVLFLLLLFSSFLSIAVGGLGFALWLVLFFLLSWFYGGFFEAYWNGQTPGKSLMGLRVLSTNGRPINGFQAVLRNLMREADVYLLGIGLLVMACNRRFQRLGDLVCGTMVVIEEQPWLGGVAPIDDPRVYQLASYLPSDLQVRRSMALALAHYAERRRFFSAPRRREVAAHLAEPLLRQYRLPSNTSYDLLLCTMYYRIFIADRAEDEAHAARAGAASPLSRPIALTAPPVGTAGAESPSSQRQGGARKGETVEGT
jgi:uncharacterized RDD family membrane protein YckC